MSKRIKKRRPKERKLRYPATSPSGEKDPYFPFTDIPRPIFRDVRLHPTFFHVKKKKTWLEKRQRR
jgi:hypothetical protein